MSLTNFVDQMDSVFPSLSDFNVTALKWTDLDQDIVYQITSTRTVNTQHGKSVIISLQKADRSSCSACACGMLSKELLQNPMIMVSARLFVLPTGKETSNANGRVYNSYKLVKLKFIFLIYLKLKFLSFSSLRTGLQSYPSERTEYLCMLKQAWGPCDGIQ